MGRPAIIEPAISTWVSEARPLVEGLREAEDTAAKLEKKASESREAAHMRRFELGRYLLDVRDKMPKRGTATNGWKAFLEAIEVDDSTAHRYMEIARTATSHGSLPETQRAESREGAQQPDTPAPRDEDAPRELAEEARIPQPEVEIDRDTWCTPKWITDAIGKVDLDPCANERSHVQARVSFDLDRRGEDGLERAAKIGKSWRVFVNPPYSDVMPWVQAYKHTRFCFLLKFDPSTKWFAALIEHTAIVLLPRGTRVQFEAPEGVPPEKALANQFPHALFYADADDATEAIRELCFQPWRTK